MKRFLVAAALLLPTTNAFAEWELLVALSDNQVYIEKDRIRKTGQVYKFWGMRSYDENRQTTSNINYRSTITSLEINCQEENIRVLSVSYYDGANAQGRTVHSLEVPWQWEDVVPGTVGDRYLQWLCYKKN